MQVILFGIAREIIGEKKITIDHSADIQSVGELKFWMKKKYPALQNITSLAVAVDSEYAEDETRLLNTNEIAIIPPVSGG